VLQLQLPLWKIQREYLETALSRESVSCVSACVLCARATADCSARGDPATGAVLEDLVRGAS
jgi:hypothetical protein